MVTYYKMQKLLYRVQALYKKVALDLANVDAESQEAFELVRKVRAFSLLCVFPMIFL